MSGVAAPDRRLCAGLNAGNGSIRKVDGPVRAHLGKVG